MHELINPTVKNIEISGIRKFFNLVGNQKDVISLTIGQPDFQTPEHVKEAAKDALDQNLTTYTPNAGTVELREAISHYVKEKYNLNYNPQDEIIVTVGASQAIDMTMRTILSPEDEVLLPGPVYPGYAPLIQMAGATPKYIDTRENDFKLTASAIEAHITNKTKCIILPYPSNPTGVSLTSEELKEIVEVLKGRNIFVVTDEIYSEITFEENHESIGKFEDIRDQLIIIQGLSKSHSMTGFRLGYVLAPANLQKHLLKVHQYNVSCASSISQHAAIEALTTGKHDALPMKNAYLERRDYVLNRLTEMGIKVVKPDGAFYVFPEIPQSNVSSFEFAMRLVNEAKLALVPGSSFSIYGEGYLRLSYAYNMEVLEEGLSRLEAFLTNY